MTTEPLISVIVPIFNTERYLAQCLDSIIGQTYRNLEILLVDDGSTDDSSTIIDDYAERDQRIRTIHKQNQGYGATCNRGLDEAQGTWVAIVEPDDWILPSMYHDMIVFAQAFEDSTPLDIVKTPYWRVWMPDTKKQCMLNCSYYNRINPLQQPFSITEAAHLLTHHPSVWSALYRRDFLNERGIRFQPIPGAGWADNPFLLETLLQTDRIGFLNKEYYCYREETPEKAKAFTERSPLLPFERWNDMADIIERLSITDEQVLRAHNSRGFTYMMGVIELVDLSHPEIFDATTHMFSRMNPELVFSDPCISPACKRLFAQTLGIPAPHISKLDYLKSLMSDGFYSLKNTGVRNTFSSTLNFLSRRRKRSGYA